MRPRFARTTSLAPILLAITLLAAAACTKDTPKPDPEAPKKATPAPSDMVFNDFLPASGGASGLSVRNADGGLEGGLAAVGSAAEGAPPAEKLSVLDPGAEPRLVRKFAFVPNKTDKRVLTMRQTQQREGAGNQETVMLLNLDLTPKAVKKEGTKFEAKVTKVDLPGLNAGAQQAQLAQALAMMNGLAGTFDVTPRGEIGEVAFQGDDKLQSPIAESVVQSLQQAIELLLPPFPDDPIGVGAKWQRIQEKKEGGISQTSKHTFTLKDASDTGGTIVADIELKVPKRQVQARGLPPGTTVEVDGKGSYTYTFRFDHVSTKVEGELNVNQKIEVTDPNKPGGGKQIVTEVTKAKHTLDTPGAAAPPGSPGQPSGK